MQSKLYLIEGGIFVKKKNSLSYRFRIDLQSGNLLKNAILIAGFFWFVVIPKFIGGKVPIKQKWAITRQGGVFPEPGIEW